MRRTTRAAAAATVVLLAAAGCGTVRYGGTPAGRTGRHAATTAMAQTPRAQADALAQTLLGRVRLPAGATRMTGSGPTVLNQLPGTSAGSPLSADLHSLWKAGQPAGAVYAFLREHVPSGMELNATEQTATWDSVTYDFPGPGGGRLPAALSQASLMVTVTSAGAGASAVRADAQVYWYPPRSAAERIPAAMRAVTITATVLNPRLHTVSRTFTSPAIVGRLATMLNDAHAVIPGKFGCPLEDVSYKIAFAASAGATPYLTAVYGGCMIVQMTVLNRMQPDILAPASLTATLAGLVHVQATPGGLMGSAG
jgi:hypothetical protein